MKIFFNLFLIAISFSLQAEPVDSVKAVKIASAFLTEKEGKSEKMKLKSAHIPMLAVTKFSANHDEVTDLYIVNMPDGGFVIVSGDTKAPPVLAFSMEGKLTEKGIPEALKEWIKWKANEIKNIAESEVQPSEEITSAWAAFENNSIKSARVNQKDPLIKTKWGQGDYYNDLCPTDENSQNLNSKVPAGCVSIALAQILMYWEYPSSGVGSNIYNSSYGSLFADFGATVYDYDKMPDFLTTPNNATATLVYHCGVSINTKYGPTGSSANLGFVCTALLENFKYSDNMLYYSRAKHYSEWNALLKNELDNNRPVIYSGEPDNGGIGHAFICDGYSGDAYYHINWGWNGHYNGYFMLDELMPGISNYSYSQTAIFCIEPSTTSLALYPKAMTLSSENGSSNEFRIVSKSNWNITSDASWLTFDNAAGQGSSKISVTADINNTGAERSATINVSCQNGIVKSIHIRQLVASEMKPNLTPFFPGWDDGIIISNKRNTNTNNSIFDTDSVFVDICYINNGEKTTNIGFISDLYLNDVYKQSVMNGSLDQGESSCFVDLKFNILPAGKYELELRLDSEDLVQESDEDDNIYPKSFTVYEAASSLAVNPAGFSITDAKATKNIGIDCIGDWKAETYANWISLSKATGTGDDNLNITVSANSTSEIRTADIVISNAVISKTVTVTQNGVVTAIDNDETSNQIRVYPNPTHDKIFITGDGYLFEKITILDSTGMIMIEIGNYESGSEIDISALPCGIYLLIIDTEGKQVYRKIIKH